MFWIWKNALLNLIKQQTDDGYSFIHVIDLYNKDPNKVEYKYLT